MGILAFANADFIFVKVYLQYTNNQSDIDHNCAYFK